MYANLCFIYYEFSRRRINMKKRMATFIAIIMALTTIFTSGAVYAESADTDVSSAIEEWGAAMKEKYDGTTINVLLASHPSTTAMESMMDEFTELTGIEGCRCAAADINAFDFCSVITYQLTCIFDLSEEISEIFCYCFRSCDI
jgi:hypothetical protein